MNSRHPPFPRSPLARRRPSLLGRDTELLSIDVFGTALDRLVVDPADVHHLVAAMFRHLGHRVAPLYPEARHRAEQRARQAATGGAGSGAPGGGAIGLAAIGDHLIAELTPLVGDARAVARQAIEREVALEQQLSRAAPDAGPLVAEARQRGVPLAFVADTYLPRDLVALLLRSAGLPAGLVLVSSHEGVTKADGRLFQQLAERSGVRPERITHVGPDYAVDVERAGAAGLNGQQLIPARERAAGLLHCGFTRPSALDSVALGLAAHRLGPVCCALGEHPQPGTPDPSGGAGDAAFDLGYHAGGPLGAGFAAWVGQVVDRRRPDLVLLPGPAGPLLRRLIRELWPDLPPDRLLAVPDEPLGLHHLRGLDTLAATERRILVAGLGWPDPPHRRLGAELDRPGGGPPTRLWAAYLGQEEPPPAREEVELWAFGHRADDPVTDLARRGLPVLEALLTPDPGSRAAATTRSGVRTLTAGAERFAHHFGPWLRLDPAQTTAALAEPALRVIDRPRPVERRLLGLDHRPGPASGDDGADRSRPSGPGDGAPARAASALVGLLRRRDAGR